MNDRTFLTLSVLSFCLLATPAWGVVTPLETPDETVAVAVETGDRTPNRTLLQQGRSLYSRQRYAEAARVWERAATEFETDGNFSYQALALSYFSLASQQLGEWETARDASDRSIALLQAETPAPSAILAQVLNIRGHFYLASGQPELALETWQQATDAYDTADDADGAIASQINEAQAMQALGLYGRSRDRLEAVATQLQERPDSVVKATGLRSLGNTLQAIGELEEARVVLQQSLDIAETTGDKDAIASVYLSLGNTANALSHRAETLGQEKLAEAERTASFAAYRQAAAVTQRAIVRVEAQLNQLSLLENRERENPDRSGLQAAVATQLEELSPSRRSIYARVRFARSLKAFGENPRDIADVLAIAVREARAIGDRRAESHALGNLGTLYEITQQWEMAETLTRNALVQAQAIDAGDIAYRWQWQLGRVLKARGQLQPATDAYGVAIKTLKSIRSDLVAISTDIQYDFREAVEPVYREYVDLLLSDNAPSQENLQLARRAIEDLQLAELDNFFRDACLDTTPVSVEEIDANAAVVYSIILPDRLATILSLPGEPLQFSETSVSQGQINQTLREFRVQVASRVFDRQQLLARSQQLYDWVIRPVEPALDRSDVRTLTFVLDGLLRNIPMAALHNGEQYLVQRYGVVLTPGMQLLETGKTDRDRLAALAAGLSQERHGFPPLANVPIELENIVSQVTPSRQLLDSNFTRAALERAVGDFLAPIVHIATHGQFSSQAEKTFILAYDTPVNVRELEELLQRREEDASEVLELLVLSACETAAGDDRAALGLAGVAVRAGARSTLATLWQVDDAATSLFMSAFYEELAKPGITKAEALRQAQLSLLEQGEYFPPYFWAPYVLVGNWM
ncbi:CHAT domain-containing protein [Geitlerinema sp. CS-897]|nr:CHAT domain-containing protein [Geitlerinema sp. CS-897]